VPLEDRVVALERSPHPLAQFQETPREDDWRNFLKKKKKGWKEAEN
jgi:hypothetical protein